MTQETARLPGDGERAPEPTNSGGCKAKAPAFRVDVYPTREAWLDARRFGIGGSDCGAILGVSRWRTPLQVWAEKLAINPVDQGHESPRTRSLGTRLEPVIAELLAEESGEHVERLEFAIVRHPTEPWLACSPDGWVIASDAFCLAELKTVDSSKAEDWQEGVPSYYLPQVLHNLYVTGLPRAYVAALIGGTRDFRWCKVQAATERYEAAILPRLREFWRCVEEREAPAPTADDAETLARIYPEEQDGKTIALPGEMLDLAWELDAAERLIKATERRIDEIKNRVRAAIGDSERGVLPDGTGWSWSTSSRPKMVPDPSGARGESRTLRRFGVKRKETT